MNPLEDGITHINIYSKGKTDLGRFLSNFTHYPFNTDFGTFQSVEGFWYWMMRDDPTNSLMNAYGFNAKKIGRALPISPRFSEEEFRGNIRKALYQKAQHPQAKEAIIASTAPFAHYYVFNNTTKNAGHKWVIDAWEDIRHILKHNPIF